MQKKKQPAKKRAYKKRKNILPTEKSISNLAPVTLTNKDTEIESLTAICSIMDNFNNEQKQRVLKFLCGRYYDFM